MPEPIRILHFADTHIGMESYGGLVSLVLLVGNHDLQPMAIRAFR